MEKKRIAKQKERMHSRLLQNWSALLSSDRVDELSQMPEDWRTGIVPCRSKVGSVLRQDMQEIGNQVERISVGHFSCCGDKWEEHQVHELKISIEDFMQNEVAVFFAERHKMYRLRLLEDANSKGRESKNKWRRASVSITGPRARASSALASWPKNTTPLFKQVMFLLRDLDDMFKASYNQRFNLRVMNSEVQAWTYWTQNEYPKFVAKDAVLLQNTPDIFNLYRQAAEVHAYYDSVMAKIAKATKAEWIPSPLKKMFRILEKAKLERKGDRVDFDCSEIFDVVRGTLIYDTLGDSNGGLMRGVCAVVSSNKFQVVRMKDRFTNPTSACWRDVLLNGRMILNTGTIIPHVVEVQFHQRDLREERLNVGGHFIYERHRALFEACDIACGSAAGAKLKELHSGSTDAERTARLTQLSRRKRAINTFASLTVKARKMSKMVELSTSLPRAFSTKMRTLTTKVFPSPEIAVVPE